MDEALSIAGQQRLLRGGRTLTVRGRMPSSLMEPAKKKSGVRSDSSSRVRANLAVADEYGDWLLAQRGTASQDLDLDF